MPEIAASYDFGGTKVACFSLLELIIVKALLVELWIVSFSLCFRPFMKLINKLKVIYWDSFRSLVLFWTRLPAILLIILFLFFISLIIRLLWRRTEVTSFWDCTDWQAILLNTMALLVKSYLGGVLL